MMMTYTPEGISLVLHLHFKHVNFLLLLITLDTGPGYTSLHQQPVQRVFGLLVIDQLLQSGQSLVVLLLFDQLLLLLVLPCLFFNVVVD